MKRLLVIVLAAALALCFAACGTVEEPSSGKQPFSPSDGDAIVFSPSPDSTEEIPDVREACDPLYYDIVNCVCGKDSVGSGYIVITDYAEFESIFGDLSESTKNVYTEESFKTSFVVVVLTTVNTGGYTVALDNCQNDGIVVSASITVTPPNADDMVTQAFVTTATIMCFDSADYFDDLVYSITVNGTVVEPVSFDDVMSVMPVR